MKFETNYFEQSKILLIRTPLIPVKRNPEVLNCFLRELENCIIKANYNLEYKFATLIFESINPENAKNVRWTDNDNLAIKMTTDVIQRHYLISDNSRITSSFCCRISCKSDEPHTNIYVLPIKFTAVDLLKNYYEMTVERCLYSASP